MSSNIRRTLMILSVIEGSAIVIGRYYEKTELHSYVENIRLTSKKANSDWSDVLDQIKYLPWQMAAFKRWSDRKDELELDVNTPGKLAYIASHAVSDLIHELGIIKVKTLKAKALKDKRMSMLRDIEKAVQALINKIDPTGAQFKAMEDADIIIQTLNFAVT